MKELFIAEKKFLAKITAASTARIVAYLGHSVADMVIPGTIEGYPVTAIGGMVFEDHTEIKRVTVPDGIISIGDYTFRRCTNLVSVIIPDSVTHIGHDAFAYCYELASVTFGGRTYETIIDGTFAAIERDYRRSRKESV